MEAWGTRAFVFWGGVLSASLVPCLVLSLLSVPGLVCNVIDTVAPLRHASNLCGPFLRIVQIAVSLGPHEGATTHNTHDVNIMCIFGPVPRTYAPSGSWRPKLYILFILCAHFVLFWPWSTDQSPDRLLAPQWFILFEGVAL